MRLGTALIIASGLWFSSSAFAEVSVKPYGNVSGKGGFFISMNFQQLPVHIGGRTVSGEILLQNNPDKVTNNNHLTEADYALPHMNVYPHQWPGIYFETTFEGTELYAKFDDTANIYNLYIDTQPPIQITKPGNAEYRINRLSNSLHQVRLEKLTESQDNSAKFEGFFISSEEKSLPAPAPRTRQIEFIGDSYTAGYGNTSPKRECTKDEVWATTDTQQAFGPLVAKHYNADYQINAYSGIGIVRNYDGVAPKRNMPLLYRSALIEDETIHAYADPEWNPAIVVIALGGNDFSTPVHSGEKWTSENALTADYIASYVAFVQQVRASHPSAHFILMDYGEERVGAAIAEVIKRLNAAGETRVASLDVGGGFALTGCDWHLNTADDKRISTSLITYIDAHPELWSTPDKAK